MTLVFVLSADYFPLCCDVTIRTVTRTLVMKVTLHYTEVYGLLTFTTSDLTPSEVIFNARYFSYPATPVFVFVRTINFQSLYITVHLQLGTGKKYLAYQCSAHMDHLH